MSITKKEFMAEIVKKTNTQLVSKLKLGDFICNYLANDSDLRAKPTISRIRHEQKWIQDEQARRKAIQRQEQGEPDPDSTIIKLNTLKVKGKVEIR